MATETTTQRTFLNTRTTPLDPRTGNASRTGATSRTVITALATTATAVLVGAGLVTPAAAATHTPAPSLRHGADAVHDTGTVGVVVRSTGPHGSRTATAGVADQETGRPARPGDTFRIASSTKTFVSTVVLQLVGEGRLSLDDTVEELLPGVVTGNGNDGRDITVRQLLNHTSGLFDFTQDFPVLTDIDAFQQGHLRSWTDDQLVATAMKHPPVFAPGKDWSYSNTNYVLAGMIIEKVTGRSWQHEVTGRIVRPLGLHRTTAPYTDPYMKGPHLKGYSAFGAEGRTPIDVSVMNPSGAGSAGAMISDTADLTAFYSALMKGRLLKPAQLAEMETTVRAKELDPAWPGARYGLGLMKVPLSCGGSYYSHGGDLSGYTTRNGFSADGRHVVVVAATGDGDDDTTPAANAVIDEQLCADGGR
ncbi:serine hydrolase [Streptomyces sp. B3I8]|uniref:serine hydrolase domain-containing protein n=1 Tax=Streptomyces sp. B3I8 TaxID=3042303 RepID=UPI00278186E2|nr:serine hydrolase domain-containing protein [Streptomyces sp. B3I8]MDQ0788809.1 D-alanyl-D-alanine carboxypeptidase [Streptomyces sp. B3I8]